MDKSGVARAGLGELLLTLHYKLAGWRGFNINCLATDHIEWLPLLIYLFLFLPGFLYNLHSVVVQLSLFLRSGMIMIGDLLLLCIKINDVLLKFSAG